MTRFMHALAGLLIAFSAIGAAQQDSPRLDPGQRVRIHRQGGKKFVATFISADSAQLALATGPADTVVVPRSTITAIDRSIGRKSMAGKGALYGAVFGLVGGVTVAAISCESGYVSTGFCVGGVGLVSTALGAAAGAIVGAFMHTDRWAPAAWPTLTFLSGGSTGIQIALGGHLTF